MMDWARKTRVLAIALIAAVVVASGTALAWAKTEFRLSNQLPPSHHISKGLVLFAGKVKEYSKGVIEVKIFDSAQLFGSPPLHQGHRAGPAGLRHEERRARQEAHRGNIWGIVLPFLILGGIYTGAFTPTEAAAVGLTYSLFITLLIYRTLRSRDLPGVCLKAVRTSCMIAMIIGGAILFGRVMTLLEIPQKLTALIIEWQLSPIMFVLAMNILLLLLLGCILETVSIILLTMPLVAPILEALKIDPIWYAIVLTVNMEMALVTPPVGMNLYVINGLDTDIHMSEVIRGVAPFIVLMAAFLFLTMLFPPMSTWLPSMMK